MTALNKIGISGLITISLGIIVVPAFISDPCMREAIDLDIFLICIFIFSFVKKEKTNEKN